MDFTEDAYSVLSTQELYEMGLISDCDLDDLNAPWPEEIELLEAA